MHRKWPVVALLLSIVFPLSAHALGDCPYDAREVAVQRSDLAALKTSMKAVIAAIGKPPAPYALSHEEWNLPSFACEDAHGAVPSFVGYQADLSADAGQQKVQADYQKKIMAAQAAGNYDLMIKLSQEMQQQIVKASVLAQTDTPISMEFRANETASMTVDPDAVVRDGTGFIALKATQGGADSGQEQITFYFDKQALKEAHTLASFELGGDRRAPDKLGLISMRIRISGPTAIVEAMARKLDAGAVLAHLSAARVVGN